MPRPVPCADPSCRSWVDPARRSDAQYCSDACRRRTRNVKRRRTRDLERRRARRRELAAYRQALLARRSARLVGYCASCGRWQLGRVDRIYCSNACRQRAYRQRASTAG